MLPTLILTALGVAAVFLLAAALVSEGRARPILVAAGLCALFAVLVAILNVRPLAGFDARVDAWLGTGRNHRRASRFWDDLGDPGYVMAALVVSGTVLSLRARSALPSILLAGGFTIGFALEQMFKALIGRTATTGPLVSFTHSFPSGHVTGTAVLLGVVAICLGIGRGAAAKTTLAILAVQGVLFVALLAVYTRAHTVSDTVGGVILGGFLVAVAAAILEGSAAARRTRRRSRRELETSGRGEFRTRT